MTATAGIQSGVAAAGVTGATQYQAVGTGVVGSPRQTANWAKQFETDGTTLVKGMLPLERPSRQWPRPTSPRRKAAKDRQGVVGSQRAMCVQC